MKSFPLITAHTGCMGFPDNSLESAAAAIRLGADILEDDIRVTRDGVPVLSHDDEVLLRGGGSASLAAMSMEQLQTESGSPVVRLEWLLELAKDVGMMVNLDIKTDDAIGPAADLARQMGMADRVFLSGCGPERAKLAESIAPDIPRLLNVETRLYAAMDWTDAGRVSCRQALDAGCTGINVPHLLVTEELAALAAESGLPLYAWTADDLAVMNRLAELGVRSITTRKVDVLARLKLERLEDKG